MVIRQNDDGESGSFYVGQFADRQAEITYTWRTGDSIVINHTEVNEELEGQGVGRQLVERVVEFAREKSLKVIPVCSFAKKVIDKTPEFQDVL